VRHLDTIVYSRCRSSHQPSAALLLPLAILEAFLPSRTRSTARPADSGENLAYRISDGYLWKPGDGQLLPFNHEDLRGDSVIEVDRMSLTFKKEQFNEFAKAAKLNVV